MLTPVKNVKEALHTYAGRVTCADESMDVKEASTQYAQNRRQCIGAHVDYSCSDAEIPLTVDCQ